MIAGHADLGAERLAQELRRRGVGEPELALVLGSGLGSFVESLSDPTRIDGAELEFLPKSIVPGHAGFVVAGETGGVRVVVQMGRVHLYEGRRVEEVTRAVRAFARLGVRGLVLTNAAGGLHRDWPAGTLMRLRDHLNLQAVPALPPGEAAFGVPYDAELGGVLDAAAADAEIPLARGVYAGLLGPAYETPAEIEMLSWMGADAVGMSTVAEASAARLAGLRVAGISCITNLAAGLTAAPQTHDEVVEAAGRAAGSLIELLRRAVRGLARASRARTGP